jgi:hypothetical protein
MLMPQIEIDFEVYKQLTMLRPTEDCSYNEVVRGLLKLPKSPNNGSGGAPRYGSVPWEVSGTKFPPGSDFMVEYKGTTHTARVVDGKLELSDGSRFSTPSAAAVHIAGHPINGWRFWKCKLPGSSQFVLIERLRGKSHC